MKYNNIILHFNKNILKLVHNLQLLTEFGKNVIHGRTFARLRSYILVNDMRTSRVFFQIECERRLYFQKFERFLRRSIFLGTI